MKDLRLLNAGLAAVLVGIWGLIVLARPDYTRRNFRWLPQMEDSHAFESQSGSLPVASGEAAGQAMRGVIARGYPPLPYTAAAGDAERAGRELHNPFKQAPDNLRRGAQVYGNFCLPCHGPQGLGDGSVTKKGVPSPPSLPGGKTAALPDGRMFHIITYGQGKMPPHSAQIERDDRWRAILHVRALQATAKAGAAAGEKAK